jgi:hypothetical protein
LPVTEDQWKEFKAKEQYFMYVNLAEKIKNLEEKVLSDSMDQWKQIKNLINDLHCLKNKVARMQK